MQKGGGLAARPLVSHGAEMPRYKRFSFALIASAESTLHRDAPISPAAPSWKPASPRVQPWAPPARALHPASNGSWVLIFPAEVARPLRRALRPTRSADVAEGRQSARSGWRSRVAS
ncbi:unnamed protein product [Rangifer tarandus platyrhynchus]|uniref:Uncharacterized protein n=1 Tax=Rangifer tarandus platyrhynchus TaxID=3082113 RepID=A0ABN8YNL3_RANTA|nr:unnamed protein product [Rangifer tarandus platyrhynchus]